MKPAPTVASHLSEVRDAGNDLQTAARLLDTLMDGAPANGPPSVRNLLDQIEWLSRQILPLTGRVLAAADAAELLAMRGAP